MTSDALQPNARAISWASTMTGHGDDLVTAGSCFGQRGGKPGPRGTA